MRLLVLTELSLPTRGGTAVWAAEVYPNGVHWQRLRRVARLRPESPAM